MPEADDLEVGKALVALDDMLGGEFGDIVDQHQLAIASLGFAQGLVVALEAEQIGAADLPEDAAQSLFREYPGEADELAPRSLARRPRADFPASCALSLSTMRWPSTSISAMRFFRA